MASNNIIRVRKDLECSSPTDDSYRGERFEITDNSVNEDSELQEVPANLNFVGVINCQETRLYPNSELPFLKKTVPNSVVKNTFKNNSNSKNIVKQYERKMKKCQTINKKSIATPQPVTIPPPLIPCSPSQILQERNDDKAVNGTIPPMPKLMRKPIDEDMYDIEYLDDDLNDTANVSTKVNKNLKIVENKKNKNVILLPSRNSIQYKKSIRKKMGLKEKNNYIVLLDEKKKNLRQARNKSDERKQNIEKETNKKVDITESRKEIKNIENRKKGWSKMLPFTQLVEMLKLVLPNQWSVIANAETVHIFRMDCNSDNIPKISLGIIMSHNDFQVHVHEKVLTSDHTIWKNISEPMSYNGKIRFAFVLQLLAWLHPQRVCLRATEKEVPDKCEFLAPSPLHYCSQCHPQKSKGIKKQTITMPMKLAKKHEPSLPLPPRLVKFTRDGGVDELFSAIKFKLERHIARLGVDEVRGVKIPATQEEVMASMGLQRRDSLDKMVRKSKRERKVTSMSFGSSSDADRREELRFLTSNWHAVTHLFTENLSFGTYANLGREALISSYKSTASILQQWHVIAQTPFLSDITVSSPATEDGYSMTVQELRSTLFNNVREINRLKRKFKSICPLFSRLLRNELELKPRDADLQGLDTETRKN